MTDRLRIKLHWVFSTFATGGPQRRFATLGEALSTDDFCDWHHVITAMDNDYGAQTLLAPAVSWERAPVPVFKGGFVSPANLREFRRTLARTAPDLLITSNWGTIEWLLANRGRRAVPHLHCEDGFGPDEAGGQRNPKRDLTRRLLFNLPGGPRRRFVVPSHGLHAILTGAWGVAADRAELIANGVDPARFRPRERCARSAGAEAVGPLTIGTVTALRAEKRIDRLLRLVAAGPAGTRLVVVGDGPERGKLEAEARALGLAGRAAWAGNQTDVRGFLQAMDIYALTSDTEQMPISLIEAMAAGLPVVATDVGDVRQVLAPENRPFLAPVHDEAALAQALTALAADPAARASTGAANRARVTATYSLEAMVTRYRSLFLTMTGAA